MGEYSGSAVYFIKHTDDKLTKYSDDILCQNTICWEIIRTSTALDGEPVMISIFDT